MDDLVVQYRGISIVVHLKDERIPHCNERRVQSSAEEIYKKFSLSNLRVKAFLSIPLSHSEDLEIAQLMGPWIDRTIVPTLL